MIAEERQRQIEVEGYSQQHDSQHNASEFVYAAISYAESAKVGINCMEIGNTNENEIMRRKVEMGRNYPFGWDFKPSTDVRDLVKAGALIAAAIDRILPSLKESEDEKVRKGIIELVKQSSEILNKKNQERMLTWLEDQGMHKPDYCHHEVDLSNCSEEYRKAYYDGWNNCNMQYSQCKSESNDVVKCLINGMKFYYEDNEEATWGTEKFSMKVKDILTWLERQGEHANFRNKIQVGDKVTRNGDGYLVNLSQLKRVAKPSEKQGKQNPIINVPTREVILSIWDLGNEWKELTNGCISTEYGTQLDYIQKHWHESEYYLRAMQDEQKPTYTVKPKFKVGDIIKHNKANIICKVLSVNVGFYRLINILGGDEMELSNVEKNFHLWTIQDGKDGDILAFKNNISGIIICKSPTDYDTGSYCRLVRGNLINKEESGWDSTLLVPATKEQRDQLEKAMADAGYTFDFEKKELLAKT